MNDNKKSIYTIILNYNNYDDTVNCINSFDAITAFDIKIILVDNASEKECVQKLDKFVSEKNGITFIKNTENLGYAAGNNIGIKEAIRRGAKYLAIVNNDVVVNEDSFTASIDILNDKKVAFSGPII